MASWGIIPRIQFVLDVNKIPNIMVYVPFFFLLCHSFPHNRFNLDNLMLITSCIFLACRHMVCTSTVSCLGMEVDKLLTQTNSLADILVKLTNSQLNKININLELLSKLFKLMCNFALSPDTLSVICKVRMWGGLSVINRMMQFSGKLLNPRLDGKDG